HGVALKPGKPLCLAVADVKPVAVLPGFPTSAIFTFHAFVAPVIRARAGLRPEAARTVAATVPVRIASELGREELVLVALVPGGAPGRMRRRAGAPERSGKRRLQRPPRRARPVACARLDAHAGHRPPFRRPALRGTQRAGCARRRTRRSVLPDGQPQCRLRYP